MNCLVKNIRSDGHQLQEIFNNTNIKVDRILVCFIVLIFEFNTKTPILLEIVGFQAKIDSH